MSLDVHAILDKYEHWDGIDKPSCLLIESQQDVEMGRVCPEFKALGLEVKWMGNYVFYAPGDTLVAPFPKDRALWESLEVGDKSLCIYCRHWRYKPYPEPCPNCGAITN